MTMERPRQRAPWDLLPRRAAAHRARRQLAVHGHAVAALRTVEFALHRLSSRPELDEAVGLRAPDPHPFRHRTPLPHVDLEISPYCDPCKPRSLCIRTRIRSPGRRGPLGP